MPKSDLVQVYYLNQDEVCEKPCQIMTREEARQAKKEDKGWFICHGVKFRLRNKVPVIGIRQNREKPAAMSDGGICAREIRANVGIPTKDIISPLEILMAQQKVIAYPHTRDKLAVLAHGYWHYNVAVSS